MKERKKDSISFCVTLSTCCYLAPDGKMRKPSDLLGAWQHAEYCLSKFIILEKINT